VELTVQFLLALAIIIAAAKAAGYLSTRLGQPAVLGELSVGLILGPSVLNMLHWPVFQAADLTATISHTAHLGVLVLMFVAGLEVDLEGMLSVGRPAILAGVMGVVVPVVLGTLAILPFGLALEPSLFVGLALAATSVSISAQCLMELQVLQSRECVAMLGAAVVDDVVVILLLSLFIALSAGEGSGISSILWVLARMAAFLGIAGWLGARLIPRLTPFVDRLPISESVMALAVVVTLLYSWAAEALGGMASITGAFLAGLFFARTPLRQHIQEGMHTLAYAWLVPVFFVSIGLEANVRALSRDYFPLALVIIVVAILSKVVGSGIAARVSGLSALESLRLGVGMTSRGEVGLIVASVGVEAGLIGDRILSILVLMVLVTTVLTPIMLRALYPEDSEQ
jgi:Kef-type K+ transport system membrane component KefB